MLFLLLRFLPYVIPAAYFAAIRSIFSFNGEWSGIFTGIILMIGAYFALLKYKNPKKDVLLLGIYALIFASTGFAYSLILENQYIINLFLIIWSLILGLYLEAVFHDFYETDKAYALNLSNITLFGGILTVFFLTAAMNSFNIFLSLPWYYLLLGLVFAYLVISFLIFSRHRILLRTALLYSAIIGLIMLEIVSAIMLLPCSFYVIAIVATLAYYVMVSLILASQKGRIGKKELWRYLAFAGAALLLVVLTANWL